MEWVDINDCMPEEMQCYLIYFSVEELMSIGFAYYNSKREFLLDNVKVKPTHWMPLPKAPRGE